MILPGSDLQDLTTRALTWPERARAMRVVDGESYVASAELLKAIKALRGEVNATFDPIIAAAFAAHREACAQKKKAETPLTEAEAILKTLCADYDMEQERIARAEELRLREIARRQEETRRLEEAAALEREAQTTGDTTLLAEAEAILEQPVDTPPVIVTKSTPTVSGISYRESWSARLVNLQALIAFVAEHPEHGNLLAANLPALNALARSLKRGMRIPGVEAVVQRVTAASGR